MVQDNGSNLVWQGPLLQLPNVSFTVQSTSGQRIAFTTETTLVLHKGQAVHFRLPVRHRFLRSCDFPSDPFRGVEVCICGQFMSYNTCTCTYDV
eukprot:m.87980 g.87980  ORF g.87980 m.87980 type:complete len:94 (+) comp12846_c0_seq6:1598-1879(+)